MKQALEVPAAAQAAALRRILTTSRGSALAAKYRLHPGMRIEEFRDAVPVVGYDELSPWIERMKRGEPDVLFPGQPLAFERSSGSTAGAKWIPFNGALRGEFTEAVRAWMGDLYQRHPALAFGRAWWVVSPLADPGCRTAGGIPAGLEDDAYLGRCERVFSDWLRVSGAKLAEARDLRLISVWSPGYLLVLWDSLREATGASTPADLWPDLRIVSGWADAGAAMDAARVRGIFNHAIYQPKGLLATEGVVTLPWGNDEEAGVPALHSHFLEFEEWPAGGMRLVHELEQGREYAVVLTTGGGLLRYRLGDVVRVDGIAGATPRLRFVGRADGVCDLQGEKLNPAFVEGILRHAGVGFCLLAPAEDRGGYLIFTDRPEADAAMVEAGLLGNPYYAHARSVGQLRPLAKFLIADADPSRRYLERCTALGQRAGTVKATGLHAAAGWERWFKGEVKP